MKSDCLWLLAGYSPIYMSCWDLFKTTGSCFFQNEKAGESYQVEHAILFVNAVSKTRDNQRLSYILHVKYIIRIISLGWSGHVSKWLESGKSSKGGDMRTKKHVWRITNQIIICTEIRCVLWPKKTLHGYELCLCSYPFYPPTSPRGSSNQDGFYVIAQALPGGKHN